MVDEHVPTYEEVASELVGAKALQAELEHQSTSMIRDGVEVSAGLRGCRLWRGPMSGESPVAYGANRDRVSVRRFVFELMDRPLRRSEKVTTTCGTHRCISPAHLVVSGLSTEKAEL